MEWRYKKEKKSNKRKDRINQNIHLHKFKGGPLLSALKTYLLNKTNYNLYNKFKNNIVIIQNRTYIRIIYII